MRGDTCDAETKEKQKQKEKQKEKQKQKQTKEKENKENKETEWQQLPPSTSGPVQKMVPKLTSATFLCMILYCFLIGSLFISYCF
jgi:hypothetical protein